ncbi:MAG: glycosyltransferase family 4 protein [Actinomycetota bacterium]
MRPTIIVTNDFPPRQGGIQSFVYAVATRLPADRVVVYASDYPGSAAFDRRQPFPVVRHPTKILLPTPMARRRIMATTREHRATAAWFGAAAPLALLAPSLRRAGVERVVASTHGHEVAWAMLPGTRQVLRRIGRQCDVITYLGEYTRRRLAPALGGDSMLRQLTPGVDVETFRQDVDGSVVRERYGLLGRPVVVCVSRLVARKGQDTLIRALPAIRRVVPGTALLLVGRGPYRKALVRLAQHSGVAADVVFTGQVAEPDLPAYFAAGDVFAMPCRTRRLGMDVEGLGIVYLEASAVGLPVVAGDSGGAPDAVRPGETGVVVSGRDVSGVADAIARLLSNPPLAAQLGAQGRAWAEADWTWDRTARRLEALLAE